MKTFLTILALIALTATLNCCDMADDPDDECGANFDLETTIYYKEDPREIDTAYWGANGDRVEFDFYTPDWVTEEGICSKEHINATYTITFHPTYIDELDSIEIEGHIIVGLMDYHVPFERKTNTSFVGLGESIGFSGWKPYEDSGIGYIWGKVSIKFLTTGDQAQDKYRMFMALEKIQLDIPCKHPMGQ